MHPKIAQQRNRENIYINNKIRYEPIFIVFLGSRTLLNYGTYTKKRKQLKIDL